MSEVYIVHCVDTEGPLNETIDATFERITNIFGLDLEPTIENLEKLQQGAISLDGHEDAIARLTEPHLLTMNRDWSELTSMLDRIQAPTFRNLLLDSNGQGWRYTWFCVDHFGFFGDNPRHRDLRNHAAFDFYKSRLENPENASDDVQWHYHPLPLNGHVNGSGTTYLNSSNIWVILAKKIIERNWFPSAFRPGFHTERPDSHWFLEQWIPFDYASQSVLATDVDQPDLSDGRYGNWGRATTEWRAYHPAHDDYQTEGACRRWIARCLNMEGRHRVIMQSDVDAAFERARSGLPTLLSFTNHDFREMEPEIRKLMDMIRVAAEKFENVKFFFCDAVTGMQKFAGLQPKMPNLNYSWTRLSGKHSVRLDVTAKNSIFGPQPFLAIKLKDGTYNWQNFDFQGDNHWSFTFDENHLLIQDCLRVAVAANTASGSSEVCQIKLP